MKRYRVTFVPTNKPWEIGERLKKTCDVWADDLKDAWVRAFYKLQLDDWENYQEIRINDVTKRGIK